jgi:hypothetical protein
MGRGYTNTAAKLCFPYIIVKRNTDLRVETPIKKERNGEEGYDSSEAGGKMR